MFKQLFAFVFIIAAVIYADDSEGTEFITSFSGWEIADGSLINSIIIIPSKKDTSCSIKYARLEDQMIVEIKVNAAFGKTNEVRLSNKDIYYSDIDSPAGLHDMNDARVFITCQDNVKLIGKSFYVTRANSDFFLIPSIKSASGTNFVVAMPPSIYESTGYVIVLPTTQATSVTVNYKMYADQKLFNSETKTYNTALGQDQSFYVSYFEDLANVTFVIDSTSPVMVSIVSPESSTTEQQSTCVNCHRNYATTMLIPNTVKSCNQKILPQEQRIITNDFSSRLYISPPIASDCDEKFKVTVFDNNKLVSGKELDVSKFGFSNITFNGRLMVGLVSVSGVMPTIRFGSVFNDPSNSAYGHFIHYIPSTAEYITGITQFYTLQKQCTLEVYTDNASVSKLDDKTTDSIETPLSVLSQKYTQILIDVTGLGIHTYESSGNYVAYVICKHVNGVYDAAGYLTGFNKRK